MRAALRLGLLTAGVLVAVEAWARDAISLEGDVHPVPFGFEGIVRSDIAPVILLGEVHDSAIHHRNQAALVAAIAPSALVFEMLTPGQVAAAWRIDRTDVQGLGAALGWAESGWPAFDLYAPIFAAAPDAALYGAAQDRADVRRALTDGAAALIGDAALVPPLPAAEQAAREAAQLANHCDALPEDMLPGMVEAQRFRDASFAQVTARALEETGGPVVVITGNGHARRDWGMPVYLTRLLPDTPVLSVGQLEAPPEDTPPFDIWIVTDPAEREDPCAAFQ